MAKIDHSRPYLVFIDNLKRELNRGQSGSDLSQKIVSQPVKLKHARNLENVKLFDDQWNMINDLFVLIGSYFKTTENIVSQIGNNRSTRKYELNREEVYAQMVEVGAHLFSYEAKLSEQGYSSNLQNFIDALQYCLEKNDAKELWCLITEHVFPDALKQLVRNHL